MRNSSSRSRCPADPVPVERIPGSSRSRWSSRSVGRAPPLVELAETPRDCATVDLDLPKKAHVHAWDGHSLASRSRMPEVGGLACLATRQKRPMFWRGMGISWRVDRGRLRSADLIARDSIARVPACQGLAKNGPCSGLPRAFAGESMIALQSPRRLQSLPRATRRSVASAHEWCAQSRARVLARGH